MDNDKLYVMDYLDGPNGRKSFIGTAKNIYSKFRSEVIEDNSYTEIYELGMPVKFTMNVTVERD